MIEAMLEGEKMDRPGMAAAPAPSPIASAKPAVGAKPLPKAAAPAVKSPPKAEPAAFAHGNAIVRPGASRGGTLLTRGGCAGRRAPAGIPAALRGVLTP